jgi:hypothetical protein
MQPIKFAADIRFSRYKTYYICYHQASHQQIIISARLKEMIEQSNWAHCSPEEQEEIRCLRELGFVVAAGA